ncbi:MAG: hypothetical protein HY901_30510 [Deltaproteobacteria bacterium]|nr:hypothetical protein [Deltaproteobacteria bacterium]
MHRSYELVTGTVRSEVEAGHSTTQFHRWTEFQVPSTTTCRSLQLGEIAQCTAGLPSGSFELPVMERYADFATRFELLLVGGEWSAGALVRLDEIRIRW